MKFLTFLVLIGLVLLKFFKLDEVGIYIFVIINHFQKLYHSCLTHIILETLCYWPIAQACYLHILLNTSFHTQPLDIHFLSKQRSHFYEIQNCTHFPVLLMLAHFVLAWYLVY